MMKIRLQRVGRKNDPSFRLVAVDSRRGPKTGNFIEVLGAYDARRDFFQIKDERIKYWLSQGAQISGTANNLLVDKKILPGKKISVFYRHKKEPAAESRKVDPSSQ